MKDHNWIKKGGDPCAANPADCQDGFSFSIWEKATFPKDILAPVEETPEDWLERPHKRKYLVTSAPVPLFNRTEALAFPGFEIYRQGPELIATVSTGEKVWQLKLLGRLYNNTWVNIGIRWFKPNLENSLEYRDKPIRKLGGMEMYINGQLEAATLVSEKEDKNEVPTRNFKSYPFWIDGKTDPTITIGCGWSDSKKEWDFFSANEYDELVIWTRQLVQNATRDEVPFFLGGYSKYLGIPLCSRNFQNVKLRLDFVEI